MTHRCAEFVVTADDGTSFCPRCESEAGREYAYCHGVLRSWAPVGRGWYRCGCCGHEKRLVGARG